jgi:hypothetical protein
MVERIRFARRVVVAMQSARTGHPAALLPGGGAGCEAQPGDGGAAGRDRVVVALARSTRR